MSIEECKEIFITQLISEGAVMLTGATDKELHYMFNKKFRIRKKYQNRVLSRLG